MSEFERFVGIDWSGSKAKWQRGIAVAECDAAGRCKIRRPPFRGWRRSEVAIYVAALPPATLVGIDFAFSLPWPEGGPFPSMLSQPGDVFELWSEVDTICEDQADFYAGPLFRPAGGHLAPYMFTKLHGADLWRGGEFQASRLRFTEMQLSPAPNSAFKIVGAKTVGPGSFAGMRLLHHLRAALGSSLLVWPFEQVDRSRVVVCEVYPSAFYLAKGSKRTRDASQLAHVIAQYGGVIEGDCQSQDEADALVSAAALRSLSSGPDAFGLPAGMHDRVNREGWIFGVQPAGER